ncbi:MAG: DUF4332 domain-containing protein [Saprospiraceae bacterium]|nr:DUF4332 domain-containing protein [Saprospiraceae bacterium]
MPVQTAPKSTKAAPAKKPATKKTPVKKATSTADDLTKIEGIGPKISEILSANGIATFADLGKAKAKDLKTILEAAGSRYKMHDPTTWRNKQNWQPKVIGKNSRHCKRN